MDRTVEIEEDPVVANPKAVAVLVIRKGLDVLGPIQVNEFRTHRSSDALTVAWLDLAKLAERFRLPIDRVHSCSISQQYVLSTSKGERSFQMLNVEVSGLRGSSRRSVRLPGWGAELI